MNARADESLHLFRVLFRAYDSVESAVKTHANAHGLNIMEFAVLELLYNKGPHPIQEISRNILIANSSLTYILDKLEKKDLIVRQTDVNDRRKFIVELTGPGKILMEKIFPEHVELIVNMMDQLEKDEMQAAIEYLKKIGFRADDFSK